MFQPRFKPAKFKNLKSFAWFFYGSYRELLHGVLTRAFHKVLLGGENLEQSCFVGGFLTCNKIDYFKKRHAFFIGKPAKQSILIKN